MENLGQDKHQHYMDDQDQEPVEYPHGGVQQGVQRSLGGQHGHYGVQQDVGQLLHGGQFAHGGHGANQSQHSDKYGGAGALIKHIQPNGLKSIIHRQTDLLGQGGNGQGQADEEHPVSGGGLLLILGHLGVGGGGQGVQLGGVSVGSLVPLAGILYHQQQQGDPHGIADRIQCQGAGVSALVHGGFKCVAHSSHIGGAAYPGGKQRGSGGPGLFAAPHGTLQNGEEYDKADGQGDRAAQENGDEPATQLGNLFKVAPQQHDKDHGVQQVVLQNAVGGADTVGVEHAGGTANHTYQVDPYQRRDHIEDLPFCILLQGQQAATQEHQKRDVSKPIFNYETHKTLSFSLSLIVLQAVNFRMGILLSASLDSA